VDKDKRKRDKRLKKFIERRSIVNERKRFIQIIVNKCCKSSEYLDLINVAIKRLNSDVLKDLADKLRDMGNDALKSDLYEKYREMVADELWKSEDIKLNFPAHMFYVYKSNTSLLLWVDVRSFDFADDSWKSPEGISVNHGGSDYKLCWSDHAVERLVERYKDNSYDACVDIAFIFYFLNWFDIKVHSNDKYICIYMVNNDNNKQCDLIGIGPIALRDGKMVIKTFLPRDYVSNHYGLNLLIAKPEKYGRKCRPLDKVGYTEPLYKSSLINRWRL
jgi:hypothetical protein